MKTIIVTGGAGFIGSNFIPHFFRNNSDIKIINLDKLTYAGNLDNLKEMPQNEARYEFMKGDICDRNLIEKLFADNDVQGVIHFAAESHVDNSISGPEEFIRTNINGTFTLLDVARKTWMDGPFSTKEAYKFARFLHVSTDEVYGTLGETGLFTEETPYAPNSPYSASKAGSDLIVRSYFHTFGMNVVTTNCSNNYGPKQHDEKLIPTIIRKCLSGQNIPVYGDGKNVRDWLYVLDHCKGIEMVFKKGKVGETYNIGGRNERTNIYIVDKIISILDDKRPQANGKSYKELISYVADRPGHDKRYAIDATKLANDLGWKPSVTFEEGLSKTIDWFLENKEWLDHVTSGDYQKYYNKQYH